MKHSFLEYGDLIVVTTTQVLQKEISKKYLKSLITHDDYSVALDFHNIAEAHYLWDGEGLEDEDRTPDEAKEHIMEEVITQLSDAGFLIVD